MTTNTHVEDSLLLPEQAHLPSDNAHAIYLSPTIINGVDEHNAAAHAPTPGSTGTDSRESTEASSSKAPTDPAVATELRMALMLSAHPFPTAAVPSTVRQVVRRFMSAPHDVEAATMAAPSGAVLKRGNAEGHGWLTSLLIIFGFYKAMIVFVVLVNITVLGAIVGTDETHAFAIAGIAASINLALTVLMRHEHFINLVFRLVLLIPFSAPLWLRSFAGRLAINNGGFHIGSGLSAFAWFATYLGLLFQRFDGSSAHVKAVRGLTILILINFVVIIILASPSFRQKHHDIWEISHRYGGWLAIALFWAQTILLANASAHDEHRPFASALIRTPAFWCLSFITYCLVYPWIRLRRHSVQAEKLSDRATRLWFGSETVATCVGTRLSTAPFKDNHGFATIANANGTPGFSVIISNAGNFTNRLIQNPPEYIWSRGAKAIGVLRLISSFRPVVIVATGSGIGPCMSFFQSRPDHPMRIIWSAPAPRQSFGTEVLDSILEADPQAVIVDTEQTGRPDLMALTWSMVQEINAEAVFVVSNPAVTFMVMHKLQMYGIMVFGPIFDS